MGRLQRASILNDPPTIMGLFPNPLPVALHLTGPTLECPRHVVGGIELRLCWLRKNGGQGVN